MLCHAVLIRHVRVPQVEELASATLAKAAADGFEADAIEASMSTVEIG